MKSLVIIALALSSVAFAGTKATKEQKKAAMEACKADGKKGKELKSCVKEKLAAPAAEAKTETAPATEPAKK